MRKTPDESQRSRLDVHQALRDAVEPVIVRFGEERVAFAVEGLAMELDKAKTQRNTRWKNRKRK